MPAFATHYLFAQSALNSINNGKLKEIILENRRTFDWGAQGPDIFLYYNPFGNHRNMNRISQELHSGDASLLFKAMSEYVLKHENTPQYAAAAAYLAGYLCHYSLDSRTHPYIFFKEKELLNIYPGANATARHALIESQLDSLFIKRTIGNVNRFKVREIASINAKNIAGIYLLYKETLEKLKIKAPSHGQMVKCFRDARCLLILLYSRKPFVRFAARFLDILLGTPLSHVAHIRPQNVDEALLNEGHKPWHNLQKPKISITLSYTELVDLALKRAEAMLIKLDEMLVLKTILDFNADIPFDNGITKK